MMNIVNGGVHADNPIDFQEFMIMPVGARRALPKPCAWASEMFQTLKRALHDAGLNTNVGDEGGFAPNLKSAEAALDFVMKAIEKAGYKPGDDVDAGARSGGNRVLQGRRLRLRRRGQDPLAAGAGRLSRRAGRQLSDRLDRGRHGGGRLGRLEAADRPDRRQMPAGRRRSVRHQRRSGWREASKTASPIRSWSRSTRSAR